MRGVNQAIGQIDVRLLYFDVTAIARLTAALRRHPVIARQLPLPDARNCLPTSVSELGRGTPLDTISKKLLT